MAGVKTTAVSGVRNDRILDHDAEVVRRLKAAVGTAIDHRWCHGRHACPDVAARVSGRSPRRILASRER